MNCAESKEDWRKKLPLIQAFVDGKTIQYWVPQLGKWKDSSNPAFTYQAKNYRVKPEVIKSRRFLFLAYTGVVGVTTCSVGIATNQEDVDRWTKAACFIRWIDNDWVETEVSEDTTAGC